MTRYDRIATACESLEKAVEILGRLRIEQLGAPSNWYGLTDAEEYARDALANARVAERSIPKKAAA